MVSNTKDTFAVDEDTDYEHNYDVDLAGDAISDFLDTPPATLHERTFVDKPVEKGLDQNAQDDYEEVRGNLKQIIQDGGDAVDGLSKIAKESESPRAYEVLGGYLKTLADVNKQLMDLHKQKREITPKSGGDGDTGESGVTNNNVFVGSTEELQKYLESQK
jgi:hypothetical protein